MILSRTNSDARTKIEVTYCKKKSYRVYGCMRLRSGRLWRRKVLAVVTNELIVKIAIAKYDFCTKIAIGKNNEYICKKD